MDMAKKGFNLLKETWQQFGEDKATRLAAALTYFTLFSLAPLLVIVIAIAAFVFGQEAAQGQVVGAISGVVGQQGAEAIQEMIQNASQPKEGGGIAALLGIVTLFLGAAGVFGALQDSLNTIWNVTPKPGGGILGMIKQRFFSFTMVLGTGFLLLVSLVITAVLSAIGAYLSNALPGGETLWQIINFVFSFVVIGGLFALLFKYIPDADITWRDVLIGAGMTAFLFTVGKFVIGFYLGHSATASTFGAAGSLVVIMLWLYYSSLILFFGAEFTQVYANTYGSLVVPDEDAVPLTEEAKARQGLAKTETVKRADDTGQSVEEAARARDQQAERTAAGAKGQAERDGHRAGREAQGASGNGARERAPQPAYRVAAPPERAPAVAASPEEPGGVKGLLKTAGYTVLGLALFRGLRAIGNTTTSRPRR